MQFRSMAPNYQQVRDDEFFEIMGEFYTNDQPKYLSPTKRLIAQKQATWKHKEILSKQLQNNQNYKLHYTASPDKSYVIEPKDGELDYDMAYKNPIKFYDQVMTQEILQHKVSKEKDEDGKVIKK